MNLNESRVIKNAMEHDKKLSLKKQASKGNTFVVKSKSVIPNHVYGYKSIKLTESDFGNGEKKLTLQNQKNEP